MKSIVMIISAIVLFGSAGANADSYEYLTLAGSTFHPLESVGSYTYAGDGCISPGNSSKDQYAHKVELPSGSVIDYVRLYAYDDSSGTINAFLTTYDAAGDFNDVAVVSSVTTNGYDSTLSPLVSLTVDNATAAINVVVRLGTNEDSDLQFCGVRIAYLAPPPEIIFSDGFESP